MCSNERLPYLVVFDSILGQKEKQNASAKNNAFVMMTDFNESINFPHMRHCLIRVLPYSHLHSEEFLLHSKGGAVWNLLVFQPDTVFPSRSWESASGGVLGGEWRHADFPRGPFADGLQSDCVGSVVCRKSIDPQAASWIGELSCLLTHVFTANAKFVNCTLQVVFIVLFFHFYTRQPKGTKDNFKCSASQALKTHSDLFDIIAKLFFLST